MFIRSQMKRVRFGNNMGTAEATYASCVNDSLGHINQDLSTLPEKTLLHVGAEIGKSHAGQQPTQVNSAIGQTVGLIGDGLTNPMVLRDMWNGNVAMDLGEINTMMEDDLDILMQSRYYWLNKLRSTKEYKDYADGRMLDDMSIEGLRSLYESIAGPVQGTTKKTRKRRRPADTPSFEDKKDSHNDKGGDAGSEADAPFKRIPLSDRGTDTPYRTQPQTKSAEQEDLDDRYGLYSKYNAELLPFLPVAGSNALKETREEQHQKALNEALFSNIIRDPATGDPNINPLQMGVRIEEAIRFNGDNKILDPVFPGGSLNIGALPATTERLMISHDILSDYEKRCVAQREFRRRFCATDQYRTGLMTLASKAMPVQMEDVRWDLGNKGVSDFQHNSGAFNILPIPHDMWLNRRQIDGDVPLQANLLPAQGLFISRQMGCGDLKSSAIYTPTARRDINFNNPTRFGWNYAVPFQ